MKSKVLVIGGAGYIGSHTCKVLFQQGYQPVVFDNLSEGHSEFVKWGDFINGDILDKCAVVKAIRSVEPIAIIHFAAFAYVGVSVIEPIKYYRNNVTGSINVIDAAVKEGNIPIVFSSTCATYGMPDSQPISEATNQDPINPYGRSKLMVETILKDANSAYGLRSVCLRYFNACGADPDGEVGEKHREETHLIPRAIFSSLGIIDDFEVFGGNYDTHDGSPVRDYIHVLDLAEAHILALKYLIDGGESIQLNVGTGNGISVFELLDALEKMNGKPVPRTIGPKRAGDPSLLIADPSKIRDILGFSAKYSDIETILRTAYDWHDKHQKINQN